MSLTSPLSPAHSFVPGPPVINIHIPLKIPIPGPPALTVRTKPSKDLTVRSNTQAQAPTRVIPLTRPNYLPLGLLLLNFPCPCSLRHWQPCTPFRLHSTYTRPPYPGATPSSPLPLHFIGPTVINIYKLHHLRALSLLVPIREPHHDCLDTPCPPR